MMKPTMSREGTHAIIKETRGNQTFEGAIFLALIGNITEHGPRYVPRWDDMNIETSDGVLIPADGAKSVQLQESGEWVVFAHFQDRHGGWHFNAPVGTEESLQDGYRRLADKLKLSDNDRLALLGENGLLHMWIRRQTGRKPVLH